jgi:hypothetical protein
MTTWKKELAVEIIQAGYIRLSKKYHPDVGGTHDQMLDLTATKEHLEKLLGSGGTERTGFTTGPRYNGPFSRERTPGGRQGTWRKAYEQSGYANKKENESTGEVPIEPYPHDVDYMMLTDVTIMGITEKAFKIKIPGVKTPQWLPKSQLHEDFFTPDPYVEGDVADMIFTKWIARQKNWLK